MTSLLCQFINFFEGGRAPLRTGSELLARKKNVNNSELLYWWRYLRFEQGWVLINKYRKIARQNNFILVVWRKFLECCTSNCVTSERYNFCIFRNWNWRYSHILPNTDYPQRSTTKYELWLLQQALVCKVLLVPGHSIGDGPGPKGGSKGGLGEGGYSPSLGRLFPFFICIFAKKSDRRTPQNKVDDIREVFFSKSGLKILGEVGPHRRGGTPIRNSPHPLEISWIRPCDDLHVETSAGASNWVRK